MTRLAASLVTLASTLALLAPAAGPPPRAVTPADLLRRAADAARDIEDPKERAEALAGIGLAHHKLGDKVRADRALQQALEIAATIEEDTPLDSALRGIALAEVQRGNAAAALKACAAMENKSRQADLYQAVIRALADAGHIEAARKLALAQKDHRREEALVNVAKAEAKAGKVNEALKTMKDLNHPFNRWGPLVEIAKAQSRAKQPEQSRKTLAEVRGIIDKHIDPRNMSSWLISHAKSQAECGDVQGALKTYEAANVAVNTSGGSGSEADNALSLALALAFEGHTKPALALVEKLPPGPGRAGVLLLVARSQAQANDRAGAKATFAKGMKLAAALPEGLDKDWTQNTIAEVQMRMGEARAAITTARAIKTVPARTMAFVNVGIAQRASDRAAAAKVFAEIASELVDSNTIHRHILPYVMRLLAEAGGAAQGLAILEKEKSPSLKARGLTALAEGLILTRREATKP